MTIRLPNMPAASGSRVPSGIVLKPPVRMEDLAEDIDHDPAEAEALVALVRRLRSEGTEPVSE